MEETTRTRRSGKMVEMDKSEQTIRTKTPGMPVEMGTSEAGTPARPRVAMSRMGTSVVSSTPARPRTVRSLMDTKVALSKVGEQMMESSRWEHTTIEMVSPTRRMTERRSATIHETR